MFTSATAVYICPVSPVSPYRHRQSPTPLVYVICTVVVTVESMLKWRVKNMSLENLGQAMENRPDLRRTQFFSPRVPMILYCGLVWYGEWYGVVELNPD